MVTFSYHSFTFVKTWQNISPTFWALFSVPTLSSDFSGTRKDFQRHKMWIFGFLWTKSLIRYWLSGNTEVSAGKLKAVENIGSRTETSLFTLSSKKSVTSLTQRGFKSLIKSSVGLKWKIMKNTKYCTKTFASDQTC